MTPSAVKTELKEIQPLRALFLQEANRQVRYNACHERGWTDSYLLTVDGVRIGYGSVKGQEIADRDTVFEFFVIPPVRKLSSVLFGELLAASGARYIECQSNDPPLSSLLFEFAREVEADTLLFEDHAVTAHVVPGAAVRPRRDADRIFEHKVEPVGDHVVALDSDIVATGGFMLRGKVRDSG